MDRLEILAKVDEIQEKHCKNCTLVESTDTRYCIRTCAIGKEIAEIGKQLLTKSDNKIQRIINKGANMTTSDILYLYDKGTPKHIIAKTLGMKRGRGLKLINRLLEARDVQNGKEPIKNNKQVVRELMQKGLSAKEIAEKTDLATTTVSTYMSQIRKEKNGKAEVKTEPKSAEIKNTEPKKLNGQAKPQEKKIDMVNHPPHYTKGKYETIDVIMDVTQHLGGREGYLVGNIIKYLSRYYFKNGIEDVEKAQWYLNKLLEVVKSEQVR